MKTYNLFSQICRGILDIKCKPTIWAKSCYSSQTLYDLLKISPKASQSQIKAAYFRLSKQYHPDVNKDADAKYTFNRISEAYKVLSNTGQRTDYDRQISHKTQKSPFANSSTTHQDYVNREVKHKSNTGQCHTGKTAHFDFDEFYRNHYPEMVKQAHEAKQKRDMYDKEIKLKSKQANLHATIKLGILIGILIVMTLLWFSE